MCVSKIDCTTNWQITLNEFLNKQITFMLRLLNFDIDGFFKNEQQRNYFATIIFLNKMQQL